MTQTAPRSPATVRALIDAQAAARPEATYALATESGARITFAELARSCREVTALLRSHGVGAGDTVSMVLPNGLATVRLLLGAMHGGVCVNPVNLLSQPEQMRYVIEHSDCRVVFVAPDWEDRVRGLVGGLARKVAVLVVDPDDASPPRIDEPHTAAQPDAAKSAEPQSAEPQSAEPRSAEPRSAEPQSADPRSAEPRSAEPRSAGAQSSAARLDDAPSAARAAKPEIAPPSPDAIALLMYTSGTTGVPKGVMLTQSNLAANAVAISTEHGLSDADRVLAVLPLYHINAFAVTMLAPLAHGGSLAMAPRFSAARFWAQAAASGCTWLNVVPTMISYLLEGPVPPREQTARLRFCRSASAALPPEHLRAFEEKFGIGMIETMGLTETVAPAFSNPLEPSRRKLGSVGRASGCAARVIDASLQPVPDGSTGEIAIRGPNVMRGYYKNEAATTASFTPDGWLRTGDLGHRDADGFFFVTGRIKELIIKGGENIAPREIDEALLAHPAILEAAAVGIPDRHYGQEIMACVVLREGSACGEDELREFCIRHLGPYKTPKVFRFVADLPRGPSGKVQRLKLLELLAS